MTLLERAYDLIANPPRISDYEGDGGVHPNDFRAVRQEWIDDYEIAMANNGDKIDPARTRELAIADAKVISKLPSHIEGPIDKYTDQVCLGMIGLESVFGDSNFPPHKTEIPELKCRCYVAPKLTDCPECLGKSYNVEMGVCEICNFVD